MRPSRNPKSHPCIKELGRSNLPDDTNWAVSEFADAELGDVRRPTRLVELAHLLAQHPTAALPEACGDGARRKAADRVVANDALAPQDVRRSPIEATYGRLSKVPVVLAVQETTEVDWTAHHATQGLGPVGHLACQGRLVQSTLAFTPERVPLGLVARQVWARDPADVGKRARRKPLPIAQQERQNWLTSLEAVVNAHAECPQTRFVSIGAREADVDDRLAAARPAGVALVIRAAWDRCVQAPEHSVGATVEAPPVVAQLLLQGPRRDAQPAREATLALRLCRLTRCPPRHRQAEGLPEVVRWAVPVREVDPPAEVQPIAWLLLTTVAVDRVEDASERVPWDACRWGMEVWHRMSKSGGRIEARQLATDERLERGLTRSSVMAWRVLSAVMLARAAPERPCDVWLALEEGQALYGAIHHGPTPPDCPPTLGEAVRWLAQLGGFVGRRRRDQPGAETLSRGFQHVTDLTRMYRMMRSAPP
jgi:transposase-like protein/transposase Tn5 family protein